MAELWLVDEDRQVLTCIARHTEPDRKLGRFSVNELEFGTCLAGRVHHAAAPQWMPDFAADGTSPRSPAAARAGLQTAVGVPICTGTRVLGAPEFIRELIVAGTREGLAAARTRGRVGGRPTVATPDIIRAARDLLPNPEASVPTIARLLGVSPGTLYNHIPDLRELRAAGRARAAAGDLIRYGALPLPAPVPESRRPR